MGETGGGQAAPDGVIEAQTVLGPMWVEEEAGVLTSSLLEEGIWDPITSRLMEVVLGPGMTFVDVGANIGYFTVLGSRLVGPAGRVFAVEPDPRNLSILQANLDRFRCSNVTVLPLAAWSEAAELDFSRPADGSVSRVGGDDASGLKVMAERLDALIDHPVDYLKVDCELTDHVVVSGADGLLRENPSMLISVEFHPWHGSHVGDRPPAILDQYQRLGLVPYEIVRRGVRPTSWQELAAPKLPRGQMSFDFVMSRCGPEELEQRGLIARRSLLERQSIEPRMQRLLRRGGDLLGRLPEPIRPAIRHRDRRRRPT